MGNCCPLCCLACCIIPPICCFGRPDNERELLVEDSRSLPRDGLQYRYRRNPCCPGLLLSLVLFTGLFIFSRMTHQSHLHVPVLCPKGSSISCHHVPISRMLWISSIPLLICFLRARCCPNRYYTPIQNYTSNARYRPDVSENPPATAPSYYSDDNNTNERPPPVAPMRPSAPTEEATFVTEDGKEYGAIPSVLGEEVVPLPVSDQI